MSAFVIWLIDLGNLLSVNTPIINASSVYKTENNRSCKTV